MQSQSAALKRWIELSLNLLSDGTKKEYLKTMRKFLKLTKVTAEEAAGWDVKKAEKKMRLYIGAQKKRGIAPKTLALYWAVLKNFFNSHDVKIDSKCPIRRPRNANLDQALSREDVRKALDSSPLKVKLGMALEAFSGLRPSDAFSLTFGDFEPEWGKGIRPVALARARYINLLPLELNMLNSQ